MPTDDDIRDDQGESGAGREDSDPTDSASRDGGQGAEGEDLDNLSAAELVEQMGFKTVQDALKSRQHATQKISQQGEIISRLTQDVEAMKFAMGQHQQPQQQSRTAQPADDDFLGDDLFGLDAKQLDAKIGTIVDQRVNQRLAAERVQSEFRDIIKNDPDWDPQTAAYMEQEYRANPHLNSHPNAVRILYDRAKARKQAEMSTRGQRSAEQIIQLLKDNGVDVDSLRTRVEDNGDGGTRAVSAPSGSRRLPKSEIDKLASRRQEAVKKGDVDAWLNAWSDQLTAHVGQRRPG